VPHLFYAVLVNYKNLTRNM